jgi:hypothetical protein
MEHRQLLDLPLPQIVAADLQGTALCKRRGGFKPPFLADPR